MMETGDRQGGCRLAARSVRGAFVACLVSLTLSSPAWAKSVEEALHDMAVVQGEDPNAFTLMVTSVALIFICAVTLMTITAVYMFKPKKK